MFVLRERSWVFGSVASKVSLRVAGGIGHVLVLAALCGAGALGISWAGNGEVGLSGCG